MAGVILCAISISNNKIKDIKKLHLKKYRDETGMFIAEGVKALEELITSDVEISKIYTIKELPFKNIDYTVISEDIMKKISTTASFCEVLAVAKKKVYSKDNFKQLKKLALFENISDPGNLGTIIRSASAFGVDGIILYGDCVELYSPKVIRSSAGNFFKTPIICVNNTFNIKEFFKDFKIISTTLSNKNNISLAECKKLEKYVVMFGSEASGLSSSLSEISDYNIRLDMKRDVESLNLSVSASIVFYELMT